MKVMETNCLYKFIFPYNVVKTNGTGTCGYILLGEKFPTDVNKLVNNRQSYRLLAGGRELLIQKLDIILI